MAKVKITIEVKINTKGNYCSKHCPFECGLINGDIPWCRLFLKELKEYEQDDGETIAVRCKLCLIATGDK